MIRIAHCLVATMLGAGLALAAQAEEAKKDPPKLKLEPGLWKIDRRMLLTALPLPPKPRLYEECLKAEDIPDKIDKLSPHYQNDLTASCKVQESKLTADSMEATLVCGNGQAGSLSMFFEGKTLRAELVLRENSDPKSNVFLTYRDNSQWSKPCP
ncbi:DUF3617 domain-containing protein [Parachitinimonas caeni]|uniref:DUF3617 family protein n=1 Tax=Parachitinimonas caeni TaxID=3031301 RepID=A0ABT7DWA7_9NEIS|nr:DUF3617 family protein [Parachitinimonas caeni]MDK2124342.1 hypothetical protein [Parachitinimonas caeni]